MNIAILALASLLCIFQSPEEKNLEAAMKTYALDMGKTAAKVMNEINGPELDAVIKKEGKSNAAAILAEKKKAGKPEWIPPVILMDSLSINTLGYLSETAPVMSKIDPKVPIGIAYGPVEIEAIKVETDDRVICMCNRQTFVLVGFDTRPIVDGQKFKVPTMCIIKGTEVLKSIVGTKKVFVITALTKDETKRIIDHCEAELKKK